MTTPESPRRVWVEALSFWAATAIAIRLAVMFLGDDGVAIVKSLSLIYLPLVWILRTRREPAAYGLAVPRPAAQLGILLIVCLVTLTPVWLGNHFLETRHFHRVFHLRLPPAEKLGQGPWLGLASLVAGELLAVALPEEVFYRGYLQTRLDEVLKRRVRVFGAEVGWGLPAASAIFVIGHLAVKPAVWQLGIFFPALVFGWLRVRTRSLFAPVLYHAVCNIGMYILQRCYY